ncbi:hypothetical protein Cni_G14693 [Canna indica]|uniref:glutathione transferase n=1 Tax=Canna indica TaxID=4628 RepID=A0AAQ3KCJ9_9LILI|nr:hypothetical protein Cni_G14693 [Canna indica]
MIPPTGMTSVKVFGSPTSAEVARVLTCLFEKQVEFQLIRVDTYKGQKRLPEYLKLQPFGQALTFEDGKLTLVDSRDICRHVAEKYAGQGTMNLLGSGTLERASIEQWLQTEAQSFDPPSSALIFNLAFAPLLKLEQDEEVIERSKKKLNMVLDIYEQRLDEAQYLAGDKFTLADLSHLPNAQRLVENKECCSLFTSRKNVSKWWETISKRETWKRVVEMQHEPPHAFYQKMVSYDRMETLLEEALKIHGRDKKGRKILRIVGKFFPARELMAGGKGGEEVLRDFLERKVFPELGGAPFVVVYMHAYVQRSENFPGVAALRSVYEALPAAVRDGIRAVYFVHPGLQARLFFATFGRFLFSSGLYGKLRYVSRMEFLWEHIRRGEVEVPEFVQEHDEELEHRPLMDYGLVESDHHHRAFDAPAMDSAASMYSLRCIS